MLSRNLLYWKTSYCTASIISEKLSIIGIDPDKWATIMYDFTNYLVPGYSIELKMYNSENFVTDEPYGFYIKIAYQASGPDGIKIKYWWLQFFPPDYDINWRILAYVDTYSSSKIYK